MTDLDTARRQMTEIIQWWPILDDVADSLLGITGHGVTLDGVRSDNADSATELAVIQLDHISQLSRDLTLLARKLGWQPRDGNPRLHILAHLDEGRDRLAPQEFDQVIADTHKQIARLTGHAPRPTGRTCPACGESQLTIVDTGLHCDTCNLTRHPDEIEALTNWRITHSTLHAPPTLVAKHLDIPASTIRTWISRGHLTRQPDGTIHIPTARNLAARHTTPIDPPTTM